MSVNSCFDKLEINVCHTLLNTMRSHLKQREQIGGSEEEDTDFDRWIHGQVYRSEYNTL